MTNFFRAIRQFERFLFQGVPEQPEPTWERNISAHVEDRYSGKSQLLEQWDYYDTTEDQLIATIIYQPDEKQIKIVREENKPQASANSG